MDIVGYKSQEATFNRNNCTSTPPNCWCAELWTQYCQIFGSLILNKSSNLDVHIKSDFSVLATDAAFPKLWDVSGEENGWTRG